MFTEKMVKVTNFSDHGFDTLPSTDGSTLFNFLQCSYTKFFGRKDVAISFFLHSQKLGNNKIILLIHFNN